MEDYYQHLATDIVGRMTELLQSAVAVTDERGVVVAASAAHAIGLPAQRTTDFSGPDCIRTPLHLDTRVGEVVVARSQNGEELSPRLAQAIVDLVVSQAIVVNHLPSQHILKNKFIHDILHGLVTDEAAILHEAKLLGLDLMPPRAVILIDAVDAILGSAAPNPDRAPMGHHVDRQVRLLIGSIVSFFRLPNDTICAHLGDGEVAILKASNTRNLEGWADPPVGHDGGTASWADLGALMRASEALLARLRADTGAPIHIGIGRYHPGLRGLARSYQDARVALSLGRDLHGPNRVHRLDRLGVAAFVGLNDDHTKIELALHLLSPLDHEPELLATIEAFFAENCAPSSTASRLGVHRNTLGYRLDKIASLTGLDPRCFDDALQIRIALILRSLHSSSQA
jgi:carbohydrate diacid regulator